MGTYCTLTSLETYLIGVEIDAPTKFLLVKCMTRAENEINKYLAQRYDTSDFLATSTSVPPLVRSWCEDLSAAYYYQWSSRGGKEWIKLSQDMRKDVIDNLKMVVDYKAGLVRILPDLDVFCIRIFRVRIVRRPNMQSGFITDFWFPTESLT